MPPHEVDVEREPWEFDRNFDRCQALDEAGNHLGNVWFERVRDALNQPTSRRQWLASLVVLPLTALSVLFKRK